MCDSSLGASLGETSRSLRADHPAGRSSPTTRAPGRLPRHRLPLPVRMGAPAAHRRPADRASVRAGGRSCSTIARTEVEVPLPISTVRPSTPATDAAVEVCLRHILGIDAVELTLARAQPRAAALDKRLDHVGDQLGRLLSRPVCEGRSKDHHRSAEEGVKHAAVRTGGPARGPVGRRRNGHCATRRRLLEQGPAEHDSPTAHPRRRLQQSDAGHEIGAQRGRHGVERSIAAYGSGQMDDDVGSDGAHDFER